LPSSVRAVLGKLPVVAWMVLAALAIRLAVVPFVYQDRIETPFYAAHWEHANIAQSLLAGHGYGSPLVSAQPSAMMTPVYPTVVALIFSIFGILTPASIIATLSLNCLFSALACIPVFLMARRSFGAHVGLWAGWGWVFSPYGIYFSAEWAWSTHLLILCLCWLLYLAQDLEQSSRLGLWAGFGLLAGFAGLTEPSILTLIPFLLALACWRLARAGRRWFVPGLVASLTLAAALSPWIIRNALVFHRFVPMRDSIGMEMWIGNNGYSGHWVASQIHPNHSDAELAEYNAGEVAYMDHKGQQAKAYIHAHRRWYAWMCARRALFLWTGYWSFDSEYLAKEPLDVANVPVATCLTAFGLAGVIVAWRRRRWEAIRYGGVLFLFPLMYCFVNVEAYRMRPLDPLLVILGCYAIVTLRGRTGEIPVANAVPEAIPALAVPLIEPVG
jgi:hypothetical protein